MLHCLLTGFDPLRGLLWTSVGGHFYGVRVNRVDDSGFKTDRREWTHTPFLYRFPNVVSPAKIWLILERKISENDFPTPSTNIKSPSFEESVQIQLVKFLHTILERLCIFDAL